MKDIIDSALFQKAIELCPISIFVLDTDGNYQYVNQKAIDLFEISYDALAERKYNSPVWKITDFEGNPVPNEELAFSQVISTGNSVDGVETVVNKGNGERIYCSVNAFPLKNKAGEVEGVIASAEDVTALVKSKEKLSFSENRYKDLFQNLLDEVHLWQVVRDESGKIKTWELIDANPPALSSWNKEREEVIGKVASEIFDYDAEKQFMPIVEQIIETQQPYSWEQFFEPTNQYLSMNSVPFNDYFLSTGRDITVQKLHEKKLLEVNQLKTEFLQQLENVSNQERERISIALHDSIVQQMVVISMKMNLLAESVENKKDKQSIKELNKNIKSITGQVRDISHDLQAPDVSGHSLQELYDKLEQQLALYELKFEFDIDLNGLEGKIQDFVKTHLYRITQEGIMNIIKHAKAGHASISLRVLGDVIQLDIKDDGEGTTTLIKKEGIGLGNIQQRVKKMGGKLQIKSKDGWHIQVTVPLKIAKKKNNL